MKLRITRKGLLWAGGVVAWDARSGAETLRLAPQATSLNMVTSLGFRRNGSVLAAGVYEARASVRDVATGQTIWSSAERQPAMAAVSPNGEFALTFRAFALEGA